MIKKKSLLGKLKAEAERVKQDIKDTSKEVTETVKTELRNAEEYARKDLRLYGHDKTVEANKAAEAKQTATTTAETTEATTDADNTANPSPRPPSA